MTFSSFPEYEDILNRGNLEALVGVSKHVLTTVNNLRASYQGQSEENVEEVVAEDLAPSHLPSEISPSLTPPSLSLQEEEVEEQEQPQPHHQQPMLAATDGGPDPFLTGMFQFFTSFCHSVAINSFLN